jgi:NADPH-dependent F420 reductase
VPRPVSIIGGSGALGQGLALRLARAGCAVTIGSREAARAQEAADRVREQLGGDVEVSGTDNAGAARANELVVLSVPFRSQSETLTNLKDVLRPGQLVVDATVPLAAAVSGKATRMLGVPQGSAAEQAAEMVPEGVRVCSAFHTVNAALLGDLDAHLDEDVLVCGDRKADREEVVALVDEVDGLRGVHAGMLETSRFTEGLTPLLISINARHKAKAGIRITGL